MELEDIIKKLNGIATLAVCTFAGVCVGYSLAKPTSLERKDFDGDRKKDYIVNEGKIFGNKIFISTGEEDYQPIPVEPSERLKHVLSAEKYEGVYSRTFNPEYNPK